MSVTEINKLAVGKNKFKKKKSAILTRIATIISCACIPRGTFLDREHKAESYSARITITGRLGTTTSFIFSCPVTDRD